MNKLLVFLTCSTIAFAQSKHDPASTNMSGGSKANQAAAGDLPPEKVFSKQIHVSYPYDPSNLQDHNGKVQIAIDPPYHACRVQSDAYKLSGNGLFARSNATDTMIEYSYILSSDQVFKLPSGLDADLEVVGVLDREKSKRQSAVLKRAKECWADCRQNGVIETRFPPNSNGKSASIY